MSSQIIIRRVKKKVINEVVKATEGGIDTERRSTKVTVKRRIHDIGI